MRIWDVPVDELCRKHLLGEHRELHAIWSVISLDKRGYRHHPETLRWESCLAALYERHEEQVVEMSARGYRHMSDLDESLATGSATQSSFLDSLSTQRAILRGKHEVEQVEAQRREVARHVWPDNKAKRDRRARDRERAQEIKNAWADKIIREGH